ncbi:PadR family transcriptional regulator [Actinoplanes couchii]|uniref:PadR family transcriptional regulator n=1 Tax=Actinoplanes couchii TaxID=403638 RepID=A0ABQ3XKR0_9ACTN|nr:PadR family transcriptional regulator [Actinoplanes couchii]MDR6320592.1 DNA-binding PadR family transcriptional regulator [Actinoplanes couchii]GID58995.1 PadR family transcriptional regulator [Actinoplanes couchii]
MAMQEPTFFVLTALVRTPLHGYGIMQAVEELSGGRVKLKAGTLYAALDRLTAEGLITVDREEAVAGRLRRYYVLSDDGRAALEAAVERLQSNARVASGRLREAFGFIGGVQHA